MSFGAKLVFIMVIIYQGRRGELPLYNGITLYLKVALSYKPLHETWTVCNKTKTNSYTSSNYSFKCRCHLHLLYIHIQPDMMVYDRVVLKTKLMYSSSAD